MYAEDAKALVVIEKRVVLKPKSVLQGFLCYTLAFFVYGCKYPERLTNTLEFMQRYFFHLQISNPLVALLPEKRGTTDCERSAVKADS